MNFEPLLIRHFGLVDYQTAFDAMRRFTESRGPDTPDEIWLLQHPPVFTQGMNGKPEHLLAPGEIPVVAVDRGGQVTYHGPGQLVVYLLLDLRRRGVGVRQVVSAMEQAVIELLRDYDLQSEARQDAPGVYVHGNKVASLGLRVRRNGSYHGLSLNVEMDLEPFSRINPCGHRGLGVTQLRALGIDDSLQTVAQKLLEQLAEQLGIAAWQQAPAALPA
ncbi:MAG: lipoyl(octanoyl) transferase LipB [Gammaproteobacteria bacterium]|nr:lipoyl(octanoyl) transferase LipB [Gammaproteobacteria bacterium]MCW8840830.1 lipoyl(octanoyl) transferase LipB [Gammaproteobacteria bacterium]MCW8959173.1 lipoyl(octanoyl) transferase LipB [Gammaproteobacteria bacterium]MCW8972667.1 lipoyl(octanoyl) transferase LipB [Gammaproteobacteria bacterium]MCW8992368.1 lipoyl(octanoyl) transferase LipB [Gammaproteobacteria bacterium]